MRCVVRPVTNYISSSVLCVTGGETMIDPKASQVDEIRLPITLFHCRLGGTSMKPCAGKALTKATKRSHVVGVCVCDENVPKLQLIGFDQLHGFSRIPPRIKDCSLTRN